MSKKSKKDNKKNVDTTPKDVPQDAASSDPQTLLPTPPDGGWGWVVVFGCFMIHVLADGTAYSFGVLIVELLNYFPEAGRGELGWIPSIMVGVTWLTGPIASALTNKYGCRPTAIAGGVIASLGFVLSIFAPTYQYMYLTFGVIGGIGLGLVFLPGVVSVTYYFEKKRSFATGLAVCGAGIGTFIYAPFSKFLIDHFGWKGTVLIEAGLLLNCCVCGALFRPLEVPKDKQKPLAEQGEDETEKPIYKPTEAINGIPLGKLENGQKPLSALNRALYQQGPSLSAHCIPHHVASEDAANLKRHTSDLTLHQHHHKKRPEAAGPMYRKDIFYSGSLHNIAQFKANPDTYTQSIVSIPHDAPEDPEGYKCCCCHCSKEMHDGFKEMLDFSIMKDPVYILFVLSNVLTSVGFNVPYTFLPDMAKQIGADESQGALLVSIVGITNTVGRIVFGWLADRRFMNRLMLYNSVLTLCGIATILCAFCDTYNLLIAYACCFGLFIGVYVSITSVVLVDLFGLDKLTNAFGLLLMYQGIGVIIGPPIAGWIFDSTGSYDISFFIVGAVVTLSGLMLFPIPCLQRYLRKNGYAGYTERDRAGSNRDVIDEREITA